MEIFEMVLSILGAVVVSSFISRFIPRISTPLVQIALGVALTLLPAFPSVKLDPSLFMILFIAPLLYLEAHETEKTALVRTLKPALVLAIGLALMTMVVIGYTLHFVWPTIPLAAAFALGAALGPTDAVAVSSLSHEAALSGKQKGILKGESLFNDASGVVGFQFAILAAATGHFSLADATWHFLLSFLGGAAVGVVAAWVTNRLFESIRAAGWETTTSRILMELFLPFLVYVAADGIAHVSGILAVVAFGLFVHFDRTGISPNTARTNIVSNSVWSVLSFSLNGTVFIVLGMQLPDAIRASWNDTSVPNGMLVGFIILVSMAVLTLRFVWLAAMAMGTRDGGERRLGLDAEQWRSVAIMTFGGAKGTITLSLMFTVPYAISSGARFPMRSELIFIASGVIIVTLVLANFMLPLLAPDKKSAETSRRMADVTIEVLRRTVGQLAEQTDPENRPIVLPVIDSYNRRITRLRERTGAFDEQKFQELQIQALTWEKDFIKKRLARVKSEEALDPDQRDLQIEACERLMDQIMHALRHARKRSGGGRILSKIRGRAHAWGHRLRLWTRRIITRVRHSTPVLAENEIDAVMRTIQIDAVEHVIDRITQRMHGDSAMSEYYMALLQDYQRNEHALRSRFSLGNAIGTRSRIQEARNESYTIELGIIQSMLEDEEISRTQARELRRNVYVMQVDADEA
ncbi:cation:proton antiporter [Bifidobacterium bombi]|uniref:Sodium/hydrogen exchanger n=1 Tax=Bifidobacterium bombi DSM 19703 TaxID=1341695 RepID=A0A086BPF3_9BIFI|nr:sodium:proton antiporter [Bifidobacterium bombi]KFF31817.1 sodium/hydrogen exchanger [Bifidobacterium bombi DSM 19703]